MLPECTIDGCTNYRLRGLQFCKEHMGPPAPRRRTEIEEELKEPMTCLIASCTEKHPGLYPLCPRHCVEIRDELNRLYPEDEFQSEEALKATQEFEENFGGVVPSPADAPEEALADTSSFTAYRWLGSYQMTEYCTHTAHGGAPFVVVRKLMELFESASESVKAGQVFDEKKVEFFKITKIERLDRVG